MSVHTDLSKHYDSFLDRTIHFTWNSEATLIARFMGPIWGPAGAERTQMGPMLVPWTLLSGYPEYWVCCFHEVVTHICVCVLDHRLRLSHICRQAVVWNQCWLIIHKPHWSKYLQIHECNEYDLEIFICDIAAIADLGVTGWIIESDFRLYASAKQIIQWFVVCSVPSHYLNQRLRTQFSEIFIENRTFLLKKCIEYHLQNGGHFVSASTC